MAPRKTVSPDNLMALGPERLAAILVELADGNAEVKRRLRLELAAQTGTPEPCFLKFARNVIHLTDVRVTGRIGRAYLRVSGVRSGAGRGVCSSRTWSPYPCRRRS